MQGLPHGSVIGFEIGNEPDIYSRKAWLARTTSTGLGVRRPPGDLAVAPLPTAVTSAIYDEDFNAYAQALAQATPGVPLLGPAARESRAERAVDLEPDRAGGVGEVSVHRYAFSGCAKPARTATRRSRNC